VKLERRNWRGTEDIIPEKIGREMIKVSISNYLLSKVTIGKNE